MEEIQVSLYASANRPPIWPAFFKSLQGTTVNGEIIFCGNSNLESIEEGYLELPKNWRAKYIRTENIKPAQCYEIARRACVGETVVWVADDCEFPNNVIGKAYEYWKSKNDEKLILSIQTKESGYNLPVGQLFPMNQHLLKGQGTPLMAPLGMMSRKFLDELGGVDRRYICGQYENSTVMQAYEAGGSVEIFGGPDCFIDIDHLGKSLALGESQHEVDFLRRPFALGYPTDRRVLEASWILPTGRVSKTMLRPFEPFEDVDLLTKSQSNNLIGRWQ